MGGLIYPEEMAELIETGTAMIPTRSPVAIRLGKLAEAGRTGSLHLSGDSGGVIYVIEGDIAAADSRRTPSLADRIGTEKTGSFERSWLATEATIDAAMELMSARPRHVRFREPEEEPEPPVTRRRAAKRPSTPRKSVRSTKRTAARSTARRGR